ncbi:MAG TPA: hypothetical protein VMW58_13195 [Anaerolineae bacterium]|nr:hypothetical protein [Anaerolineae bacterium]
MGTQFPGARFTDGAGNTVEGPPVGGPTRTIPGWAVCPTCAILGSKSVGDLCDACNTPMVALSAAQQARLNYWAPLLVGMGGAGQPMDTNTLYREINSLCR